MVKTNNKLFYANKNLIKIMIGNMCIFIKAQKCSFIKVIKKRLRNQDIID